MVDLATSESVGIGNLFGDSSVTTDAEVDALISTPEPETSEVTIAIPTAEDTGLSSIIAGEEGEEEKATEEFTHLRDYIKANIEQANIMIEKFNNSRKAELEEAAQYKSEKERFAKLEEDAYVNAEKLVAETAHAESMKTYFVEELKKEQPSPDEIEVLLEENTASVSSSPSEDFPIMDEPPMDEDIMLIDDTSIDGSVETALTGMAVQNTVNKTMDKKHKAKVKKEELFSLV